MDFSNMTFVIDFIFFLQILKFPNETGYRIIEKE